MKIIADLTVVPIGVGVSLSEYIASCEEVLDRSGLKTVLHSNGTAIEGEWDEVFAAVKACHEKVYDMGAPRIYTSLTVESRMDREQSLEDKIDSVVAKQRK